MTDKHSIQSLIKDLKAFGVWAPSVEIIPFELIEKFEKIAEVQKLKIDWNNARLLVEPVQYKDQLCIYLTCEIVHQPETAPVIESKKFGIYLCQYSEVDKA